MTTRSIALAVIGAFLIMPMACSKTSRDQIAGKWVAESAATKILGSGEILWFEFLPGGTIIFADRSSLGEKSWTGTYEFIDDRRIKFDFKISQYVLNIEILQDVLTVTSPEGRSGKYRREK